MIRRAKLELALQTLDRDNPSRDARAAVSDLTEVPGISAETARKIYDFFHESVDR